MKIEERETMRVPTFKARQARKIQREYEQTEINHPHRAETAPMEIIRGYTREQLYTLVNTSPMRALAPYDTISRGADTCEKMSIVLQWSGAYAFTWIIGVGYCRILEVRQKDRHTAMVKVSDLLGHEIIYKIPWYQEIHLFLGES